MAKKQWSDLTTLQKRAIWVGGAVETAMTVAVLWDLAKRPADEIRGPKMAWVLACFVQPFGPLSYVAAARR